jgi:hypothetical protein
MTYPVPDTPIYSPACGIQRILQSVGVVDIPGKVNGWVSAAGKEPPDPAMVVTLLDAGGPRPEVVVGTNWPRVQIIVRGSPSDYNGCYGQCIAIRNALLAIPEAAVYPELTSVTELNDIINLGRDSNDRPRLAMNFQLITTPVDAGYRL